MSSWKSNADRQLEYLQRIHEQMYAIQNRQHKITEVQTTQMSVIISLLGKMVSKLESYKPQTLEDNT